MTSGSTGAADPVDALQDLSDALADLVVAARRVAESASVVLHDPEIREVLAGVLTTMLDATAEVVFPAES